MVPLATVTVVTWFIEVEEEEVGAEFTPEQARLRILMSEFSEGQVPPKCRRGMVRCLSRVGPQVELKVAA